MNNQEILFGIFMSLDLKKVSFAKLSALTKPFKIEDATLRSTLSRMEKGKIIHIDRKGRTAFYSLSLKSAKIGDNISLGFHNSKWENWNGEYLGVLFSFPENNNPIRYNVRTKLKAYRFARFNPGFWIRPINLKSQYPQEILEMEKKGIIRVIEFKPNKFIMPKEANQLWNLEKLRKQMNYEIINIEKSMKKISISNNSEAFKLRFTGADGAIKQLAQDPLLPKTLLPKDWPANKLRNMLKSFIEKADIKSSKYLQEINSKYKT